MSKSIVPQKEKPALYSDKEKEMSKVPAGIDQRELEQFRKNAKWFERERQTKLEAWETLKEEYPELKKLKDLSMYGITLKKAVSQKMGIPLSGIDIMGGKPYVNKTGLNTRILKDPRKVKSIEVFPLVLPMDVDGDSTVKAMYSQQENKVVFSKDGWCLMKCILIFQDDSIYSDIGAAKGEYFERQYNKMASLKPYVMEMASTRAHNRTIRLATGIGMLSVEETDEFYSGEQTEKPIEEITKVMKLKDKNKITDAQLMTILKKVDPEIESVADISPGIYEKIVRAIKEYKAGREPTEVEKIQKLQKRLKMTDEELDKLTEQYVEQDGKGGECINTVALLKALEKLAQKKVRKNRKKT